MNNKFLIGIIVGTLLLLGGTVFLAGKMTESVTVEVAEGAKAEVAETAWNWGDIGINDGKVEREFEIKNVGSQVLKLFNIVTSCMCTTAMFTDNDSQVFGMHAKSGYVKEIQPEASVKVRVVFDPLFHGPDGIGPITRQVTMMTNDADKAQITLMLTATVRK